ncbi:hypothetical protein EDD18DRAFT_1353828 [Armillaria luteobubalina]|uniref:Uncharacterized protein n=1 Tax=Armillaria luteobubalina TaxID=153913 RepID=A0AA39Q766_9AGAR|nr:hypothetical protein EDD18DRAFT_1353828 [Armillaria luteobubalina]
MSMLISGIGEMLSRSISYICPYFNLVCKLLNTWHWYTTGSDYVLVFVLYLSLILVTTIWCTILIIYRILTVGRASNGIGGGLGVYRHVIEVLVESSVLYSSILILDMQPMLERSCTQAVRTISVQQDDPVDCDHPVTIGDRAELLVALDAQLNALQRPTRRIS